MLSNSLVFDYSLIQVTIDEGSGLSLLTEKSCLYITMEHGCQLYIFVFHPSCHEWFAKAVTNKSVVSNSAISRRLPLLDGREAN